MSRTRDLLRRVASPVRGPLDGRVADINRRVGDTRNAIEEHGATVQSTLIDLQRAVSDIHTDTASLTRTVDAYARALAESASLTGVEIRRLADLLRDRVNSEPPGIETASRRQRNAAPLALDALDDDLAALLTHAASHLGFAAQAGLWFNPPVTIELSRAGASVGGVNERIVELPFASAALARLEPPAHILEIGCAESTFALSAASLGYHVTAVDLRRVPLAHPNLESIATRFEDWDPGRARFDAVFLISTIEHVGLAAYGGSAYGDATGPGRADRAAMARVAQLLTTDGFVVLTTPYGRRDLSELERTYDEEALSELLDGWTILDRRIIVRQDGRTWRPATDAEEVRSGVAMLVATPTLAA